MLHLETLIANQRLSTQELLSQIATAVQNGETHFQIHASGQHDLGGPLWNNAGQELFFQITNPGQRVGAMCLPNTTVLVEGSAPADVGWLNSGGRIIIRGDAGDTAGHCAAAGSIYIGGRAGARTGSLMKHDPLYDEPDLWVLRNVGMSSFEFMGGGKAVICGYDCADNIAVLGERPCVGMVGGVVYFRGKAENLPEDAYVATLDADDLNWLAQGLKNFLQAIERLDLMPKLQNWSEWQKILPVPFAKRGHASVLSVSDFRKQAWISGGIFGDVLEDDGQVVSLVASGENRLRLPVWQSKDCRDCQLCLKSCPRHAITRTSEEETSFCYQTNSEKCIGCGICAGVCPCNVWQITQHANL